MALPPQTLRRGDAIEQRLEIIIGAQVEDDGQLFGIADLLLARGRSLRLTAIQTI